MWVELECKGRRCREYGPSAGGCCAEEEEEEAEGWRGEWHGDAETGDACGGVIGVAWEEFGRHKNVSECTVVPEGGMFPTKPEKWNLEIPESLDCV